MGAPVAKSHYTDDELNFLHHILTYNPLNLLPHRREYIAYSADNDLTVAELKKFVNNLAQKIHDDLNEVDGFCE